MGPLIMRLAVLLASCSSVLGFGAPAAFVRQQSSSTCTSTRTYMSTQASAAASKNTLEYNANRIRNFSIIAHIDHGKSTLADRLLESTNTVASRDMEAQLLDNMDIERERGITIKLQAARVLYKSKKDGEVYILNLIDTPGHVDFTYEVSRSLAACEGALLVVDASQGIEAQTLANVYLALENDLEIIPVLNKIDLPAADPDRVKTEIEETIGLDTSNIVLASAKSGIGIEDILESIVEYVPPPEDTSKKPFRALIFDSYFDSYRGVIVFFRVVDGEVKKGDKIRFMASAAQHDVTEVGVMQPQQVPVQSLKAGEVGYVVGSIKDVLDARVGDTICLASQYKEALAAGKDPPIQALPGYADSIPMVYCGLFPVDADQYEQLRDALGKLRLNDAALSYEPESSGAMGFGFRCGFLGLLHMEIIQERLSREYDLDLILTAPSVVYKVINGNTGEELIVDSPAKMPDLMREDEALEPFVRMEILTPSEYNGAIIELGQERRGVLKDIKFLTPTRSTIVYELPLAEVITDFFDQLKSRTKGYASMEYSIIDYRASDLVRLDVKINYETAPPLATILHRDKAQSVGRRLVKSLKDKIPRQMFKVPIQACIGVKVIASQSISPMRKDVLAKCYGGDLSRKKKLLQKQAKGKKRMKAIGKVNVPQEAFMAVIKLDSE
ncbi:Elongation factor 4 [Seminavis robusta]|uniref:Translation factor GUF1 homolog, mitochondrial n=1 Tax=Seminavis robusta TaxID=568900 RepID=A0A9N8DK52_9STRA|nr:Elongation factor 4 [Seminavis robusta]|eukprot:Sro188_g081210.1 Elongation factor 4 (670) ;mRNA; r:48238-50647